jgi:hypothetical protein
MEDWLSMTGSAICWDFELSRRMTLTASQFGMFACQRECTGIMIKSDIVPAGRYVADGAIRSQLTVMFISHGMAGKTIFGGALKNAISMTGIAIQHRVVSNERKCSCIVIEF